MISKKLTSVSALQSSLDILRKHRPDYTPRTGFVWPITGPTLTSDNEISNKPREAETPNQDALMEELTPSPSDAGPLDRRGLDGSQNGPKRQQNTMLLMNAMKTTAAHSKMSFTPATSSLLNQQGETGVQDSELPKVAALATPGSNPGGTGASQTGGQETVVGGTVKKKKKSDDIFLLRLLDS